MSTYLWARVLVTVALRQLDRDEGVGATVRGRSPLSRCSVADLLLVSGVVVESLSGRGDAAVSLGAILLDPVTLGPLRCADGTAVAAAASLGAVVVRSLTSGSLSVRSVGDRNSSGTHIRVSHVVSSRNRAQVAHVRQGRRRSRVSLARRFRSRLRHRRTGAVIETLSGWARPHPSALGAAALEYLGRTNEETAVTTFPPNTSQHRRSLHSRHVGASATPESHRVLGDMADDLGSPNGPALPESPGRYVCGTISMQHGRPGARSAALALLVLVQTPLTLGVRAASRARVRVQPKYLAWARP
jgi:hypothetical protein